MNALNFHESSPYQIFSRSEWAALRNSVPLTLNQNDILRLQGINENLSIEEVTKIYLPLTRLLNLLVHSKQAQDRTIGTFLNDKKSNRAPFIISITGSVAVGKSTTARILQALLQRWEEHPSVELVSTDGFLYPLEYLSKHNLLSRKGFPESYDQKKLIKFMNDVKSGEPQVSLPIYSHITYDILPKQQQVINRPDVLIIEGLNVLQNQFDKTGKPKHFISNFIDFSIYVDAPYQQLRSWYAERFLKFKQTTFNQPDSYFTHYAALSDEEAEEKAYSIWDSINGPNLLENVEPTKPRANLILTKGANHLVEKVSLRK